MRMCPGVSPCVPGAAAGCRPPGPGRDPPPRWAGTWLTRVCRCPRCCWLAPARVATALQPAASRSLQQHRRAWSTGLMEGAPGSWGTHGPGPVPVPQGIAGTPGSHSASPQHRGSRGHRRPPPPTAEPGTYAAFSHCGNTTCSAPCSAPGRREGSPPPRCPPARPRQPLPTAGLGLPLPPMGTHGWPELWSPTGRHRRSPAPCERAKSSIPALPCARTQPSAGTRRQHPPSAPAVGSLRRRERCRGRSELHGYS